ncbi:MAG: hypothetical protein EPO68_13370 [Planctomycetota bacterium]|nr:MAG: hypothetical protein EPO68_13370 [Planctomycetota bacterium]
MGKRLYTEADVRALARGAELVLGVDALATPAALDAAFERGVRVVYAAKGGTSAPVNSSAHKPDCLWHKVLANDGNYVVEVKNGRAQVFALTPNGPVLVGTDSLQTHVGGKS